ncbi:MAG: hypothetical protein HY974_04760 [Candidatus Kerfeldbacteria bacterium]|nr:hypothetical protein [Candidatus Kerfeldbacteria bacterium]
MPATLSSRALGLAVGTVTGLASLLCALAYTLWSQGTLEFFGFVFHGLNLKTIAVPLTLGDFFAGLLITTVGGAAIGSSIAACYNHCLPRRSD